MNGPAPKETSIRVLQGLYKREGFIEKKMGGSGGLLSKEKKELFLDQDIFRGCGEEERKE